MDKELNALQNEGNTPDQIHEYLMITGQTCWEKTIGISIEQVRQRVLEYKLD